MDIYDLLRVLPLASALTWFILAALQVYRDRIHTWTETLILFWLIGLEGVNQLSGGLWIPVFNETVLLIVLAYIGSYSLGGIVNVYRLHKIVRDVSPQLARRTRGFLIVFTLIIFLGLGTNGVLGALRSQVPPPFSTLLLVVAAATIYTLYPGSRQRISEAVRRFQARRYS